MKPDNWNRFAAGLLAILLCLCSFSMPVFASGTDPAPEPLPEIAEEEPTTGGMEPEGVSITPKGNATLVDDFYGDKQLITVTTKAGNYFYILIDRANEDKETSVHFLNQVDDADLLALLDVKIIPGLGGHGDKLLVAVKIIHQCCVAFGRDGHTLRLHAARGGFFFDNLRQRFRGRVRAACKSGHGKGAEAEQDSQQPSCKTAVPIRFHWRHPPVCGTG